MESTQYTLTRDGDCDLRFTGVEVAKASSYRPQDQDCARWTELTLYRTDAGTAVVHEVGRTQREGEHDRYKATVCDGEHGIADAVGFGRLGKELLRLADIEFFESID